jgi:polyhydroxybutyrate depolymerase
VGIVWVVVLAAGVFAGTPNAARAQCTLGVGDHFLSLNHGGIERVFTVHVPLGCDPASPWPLVVDFHGFTLTRTDQSNRSGIREVADVEGFAVAYPQGLGDAWNGIVCCGFSSADDVGFARALVADVSQRLPIDPNRVYATGFSNGGLLSHRLACEAADLFAAAAPVAFQLPNPLSFPCSPSRPIAVKHFHGFWDTVVPYAGVAALQVPAAPDSLARWASINGCIGSALRTILGPGSYCDHFEVCAEGVETALCSIDGVHSVYSNNDGVPVGKMAWDFLSGFTLRPEPAPAAGSAAALLALAIGRHRRNRATLSLAPTPIGRAPEEPP